MEGSIAVPVEKNKSEGVEVVVEVFETQYCARNLTTQIPVRGF